MAYDIYVLLQSKRHIMSMCRSSGWRQQDSSFSEAGKLVCESGACSVTCLKNLYEQTVFLQLKKLIARQIFQATPRAQN